MLTCCGPKQVIVNDEIVQIVGRLGVDAVVVEPAGALNYCFDVGLRNAQGPPKDSPLPLP